MFISNVRRRAAALLTAGAAAAAVLALAAPAGGVTGTRWISPQQAGYTATGAKFKTITAHVYLRNPAQYAGMAASYGHSVQLWSPGVVATVGVTASTSGTAYMPYATIYDRTTRQVIASNPNPHWCDSRDKCGENIGDPVPAGADLLLKIEYSHFSPTNSSVAMEAAFTPPHGYTHDVRFGSGISGQSFTQARVGTDFGRSPWDAFYAYTPPASPVKIAGYFGVKLTSYSGHTDGLSSWWVHHKLLAQPSGRDLVAIPHNLTNRGHDFRTWFVPKGAQSSS
jgi:hypothetical protein